jgi:hypothetical protein
MARKHNMAGNIWKINHLRITERKRKKLAFQNSLGGSTFDDLKLSSRSHLLKAPPPPNSATGWAPSL